MTDTTASQKRIDKALHVYADLQHGADAIMNELAELVEMTGATEAERKAKAKEIAWHAELWLARCGN